MTPEIADLLVKFILPILAAAVSYGAIRKDLQGLHEKVKDLNVDSKRELDRVEHATLRAHDRLDNHVADYHRVK